MSREHIEKFYEVAVNDPAMVGQIVQGVQTPDEFVERTVAIAGNQGFAFDKAEAMAWIEEQREMKANGELSDFQLQSVAGGSVKDAVSTVTDELKKVEPFNAIIGGAETVGGSLDNAFQPVNDALNDAANTVGDWLASW